MQLPLSQSVRSFSPPPAKAWLSTYAAHQLIVHYYDGARKMTTFHFYLATTRHSGHVARHVVQMKAWSWNVGSVWTLFHYDA